MMASRSSDHINCRICLERDENESKLIKVCNCTGSQELVHYHCLKSWIESSNSKKCSVCKTVYSGLILNEKSATLKQWISNTPGICFAIVLNLTVMIFCWYFLLVAYLVAELAEKSHIFILLKLSLTIFNCMFTGMLIMYHLMAITALICSYKNFARENRSIQVRGYVKTPRALLQRQLETKNAVVAKDVELGNTNIETNNQEVSVTRSRDQVTVESLTSIS